MYRIGLIYPRTLKDLKYSALMFSVNKIIYFFVHVCPHHKINIDFAGGLLRYY